MVRTCTSRLPSPDQRTVTNQILRALLLISRSSRSTATQQRLKKDGFVTSDLALITAQGIVNKTPFVILVRKGNRKASTIFADLEKPGVRVIHPDPISSGGAPVAILAIYGSELKKSEKQLGEPDTARALQTLQAVWKNVISTPRLSS